MLANSSEFNELVGTFHSGSNLHYNRGEYIIRPGEMQSAVYFIEFGIVKAFDITKYGEENLLIIRKENEIFPLIWAVTGQERSVIYQALVPTSVWRLSREKYLEYLNKHTASLAPLLDMTIEMYRIHSERIITLEYRTIRERLISFLLTMYQRFGHASDNGLLINVPLRKQDIASSINASRERTGNEINNLIRKKLISVDHFYMTIHDMETLKSYL